MSKKKTSALLPEMNANFLRLAADLLDRYRGELGNKGCNDYDLPNDWTYEDFAEMALLANHANFDGPPPTANPDDIETAASLRRGTMDFIVVGALAHGLRMMADDNEPPPGEGRGARGAHRGPPVRYDAVHGAEEHKRDAAMSLKDLLSSVNHLSECRYWTWEAPGADDECTCGLTRYARVLVAMPQATEDLVESAFDITEAEAGAFKGDSNELRARYQRSAHAVERIVLGVAARATRVG